MSCTPSLHQSYSFGLSWVRPPKEGLFTLRAQVPRWLYGAIWKMWHGWTWLAQGQGREETCDMVRSCPPAVAWTQKRRGWVSGGPAQRFRWLVFSPRSHLPRHKGRWSRGMGGTEDIGQQPQTWAKASAFLELSTLYCKVGRLHTFFLCVGAHKGQGPGVFFRPASPGGSTCFHLSSAHVCGCSVEVRGQCWVEFSLRKTFNLGPYQFRYTG